MPTLHWIGKDKVINHHHDVPFKVLDHQYTFKGNSPTVVDVQFEKSRSPLMVGVQNTTASLAGRFGDMLHPIPWQTDHPFCWHRNAADALAA